MVQESISAGSLASLPAAQLAADVGRSVAGHRLVAPALPAAAQSCSTASSLRRLQSGTNSPTLLPFHLREGEGRASG